MTEPVLSIRNLTVEIPTRAWPVQTGAECQL